MNYLLVSVSFRPNAGNVVAVSSVSVCFLFFSSSSGFRFVGETLLIAAMFFLDRELRAFAFRIIEIMECAGMGNGAGEGEGEGECVEDSSALFALESRPVDFFVGVTSV